MNQFTNLSIGEAKVAQVAKGFGGLNNDLQKAGPIAGRNGLSLQEITLSNGKTAHRWVNGKGEEHAKEGSSVDFDHEGKQVTGTVGRVSKSSGRYVIKDKEGNEYKKHPHEIKPTAPSPNELDEESDQPDWRKYAAKRTTNELLGYLVREDADKNGITAAREALAKRGVNIDKEMKRIGGSGKESATNQEDEKESKKLENKKTQTKGTEEEESEEQEGEDINQRFDDFADYVEGVVEGYKKAAIMYGKGGVGKTYTTTKKLEELGLTKYDPDKHELGSSDYGAAFIEGGKITPTGFWQTMYDHNGKVIVFDDCDSALKNPEITGWLKGALGSSQSTVTNKSAKAVKDGNGNEIPSQFKFTGKMIFISNLPKEFVLGEQMQPIMSRAYSVDMTMGKKQTIDRISHIATDKEGKLTNMKFEGIKDYKHEEMKQVLDYLKANSQKAFDINTRTVETLLGMKKLADKRFKDDKEAAKKDFERKAKNYLQQHLNAEGNDLRKAIEKACVSDFGESLALLSLGVDSLDLIFQSN